MPRRFNHLWDQVYCFGNLFAAWQNAQAGKRTNPEIAQFELSLESRLFDLQQQLQTGNYVSSGYRSFVIHDPKHRLISAAPFIDRVVHHALVRVIEPLFEPTFIAHSYANRCGKGTHGALDHAQHLMGLYPYVLQCDLRQFFPSIDHQILYDLLCKKITCKPTRTLILKILQSGDGVLAHEYDMHYFTGDDLLAQTRPRGLPIGNLTSQFWANVYLNELDQLVTRELKCKAYVRYVDDFLLFASDKKTLWTWKDVIREKLNALRLTMHEKSSTVYPVKNGIPFLGMRLFPSHRRLKNRNARSFEARYKQMQQQVLAGKLTLQEMSQRVQGWVAHAQHADTAGLRGAIFNKPWQTFEQDLFHDDQSNN